MAVLVGVWSGCAYRAVVPDEKRPRIGDPAPAYELLDQRDQLDSLYAHRGRVLVLLAGGKGARESNDIWWQALHEDFRPGEIDLLNVADLRGIPRLLKGMAVGNIKRISDAPDYRVLLDWDGIIYGLYQFVAGESNLVVIDCRGLLRYRASGPMDEEKRAAMREAVRAALAEPLPNEHPGRGNCGAATER